MRVNKIKFFPIFLILLCFFCLSVFTFEVFAEDDKGETVSGDFTYIVLSDGTLSLTGYSGDEKEIVVPDTLDGKIVSEITETVFSNNDKITEVTFGDNIKCLKVGCFENCTSLETVTAGNGLLDIGDECFLNCKSLKEFYIPSKTIFLGNDAFVNCSSLKEIELPNTLMKIGEHSVGFEKSESGEYKKVEDFLIVCVTNSLGFNYARQNGIAYEEGDFRSVVEKPLNNSTSQQSSSNDISSVLSSNESHVQNRSSNNMGYILLSVFIIIAFAGAGAAYSKIRK